ncbi:MULTISPECIES: hypothetical protein [unclassified Bradyrhizobium]|nr:MULTISPECIES: hypothetical protein [unclassified Bradyrhizobium]
MHDVVIASEAKQSSLAEKAGLLRRFQLLAMTTEATQENWYA